MKKVKIFEDTFIDSLQRDINGLIADENAELKDIKFTYNSRNNMYAAMVIYYEHHVVYQL